MRGEVEATGSTSLGVLRVLNLSNLKDSLTNWIWKAPERKSHKNWRL